MIDIKLTKDDFSIKQFDSNDELDIFTYDLEMLNEGDSIQRLVRRALETPFGYIGQFIIDGDSISNLDGSFGNAVYRELSENITINFLSRVRTEIESALSFISSEIEVLSLSVDLVDLNTIDIRVTYSMLGEIFNTGSTINL